MPFEKNYRRTKHPNFQWNHLCVKSFILLKKWSYKTRKQNLCHLLRAVCIGEESSLSKVFCMARSLFSWFDSDESSLDFIGEKLLSLHFISWLISPFICNLLLSKSVELVGSGLIPRLFLRSLSLFNICCHCLASSFASSPVPSLRPSWMPRAKRQATAAFCSASCLDFSLKLYK